MGARAPGKLGRSHFTEGAMRALVVVVFAERFEQFAGVGQVDELVFVEALVAKLAVEAFEVGVLGGFSRGDETVRDVVFLAPAIQGESGKLRAVVGEQTLRASPQVNQPVEHAGNAVAGQRGVGLDPQALPRVSIDHRQHPQRAAAGQPIVDEVQAPALIGCIRSARPVHAACHALFAPPALTHLQALFTVEPVDAFMIVRISVAAQQHHEPAVAPAAAIGGMNTRLEVRWITSGIFRGDAPISAGEVGNKKPQGIRRAAFVKARVFRDQNAKRAPMRNETESSSTIYADALMASVSVIQ
jgi:hypothetical protein